MAMTTPDWIKEGYDSKADYEKAKGIHKEKKKGKTFKVKSCPKCNGTEVAVVLGGNEGSGSKGWGCKGCKWNGRSPEEKELSEKEFMEHMDKMEGNKK
ncbi:MAG TPA: hypothetical protein ENH99_01880 [Candidatus Pacearchaeota archaeon]|nr:hypothetical protein [Candidatus Pacearchaeota archaeon]